MDPEHLEYIYWELAGIILCVLASAVFSAIETALTSLSGARASKLIEDGSSWLSLWLNRPGMVITSVLLMINLFNVGAVAFSVDATRRLLTASDFDRWGVWTVIGVMTIFLVTFAEIIPKAIGKRWYSEISNWGIRVMRVPYVVFFPFIWVYGQLTSRIVRSIGPQNYTPGPVTFDEIEYIINMQSPAEDEDDRDRLLRSVVEFPDTLIKEVMVPRTELVGLSQVLDTATLVETLVECGHSRLPVFDDSIDDIMGVFYVKDLLKYLNDHGSLEGFMLAHFLREPYFVQKEEKIANLLAEFQRQHKHMAIVIDEFGGVAGLITLEDIVEEIFGDIQDEHDEEATQIKALEGGNILADARIPIIEIEEYFGIELPDREDYESLGGLLLELAGTVPQAGQRFESEGLAFTVRAADLKRVISVEVEMNTHVASDANL